MVASLEIGNGWQSPRISFTFDFSQTQTERTTNDDWQSPRISFSLNLSQTDRISPDKRRREDATVVDYDTDFEFWVNGRQDSGMLPVADELFVDGKMLPLIDGPVEAQPLSIARHLSLERLRCPSPVRSTASPPSKIICSCWGNVTSKSQPSSTNPFWSFSRTCRMGGEMKGKGLFRFSRFSRSHSTAERKCKAATSKELETDFSGLVEGFPEAWSIRNIVQPKPHYYSELKPRFEAEEGKAEKKRKQSTAGRGKLGSMGGVMSGQRRVGENWRLMVRNLERSSSTSAKAARLDLPPPGKRMAEGSFLLKANNYMGRGVRVNPVVNVPVYIGHAGGRWNGGGGLFGFFLKKEKKQPQPSAYHHLHTHSSRKKGT